MNIEISNLGKIQNAEINLNKSLILFTGYNNTGKTYLNYLLYGLYRLPYGRIEKKVNELIKVEDLSTKIIHLKTNLKILFCDKITEISNIYSELLTYYCTVIYADKNINPFVKLRFSSDDLVFLSEIINESIINENFVFNSENEFDINKTTGKIELSNGDLSLYFPKIKSSDKNYEDLKTEAISILKLNAYLQFERRLKKIASFNHIFQRDYSPKAFFFPAERATLIQYAFDIIYSKAEKYEESDNLYPFETELNKNIEVTEYPKAINDYIKFIFNLKKKTKNCSQFEKYGIELEKLIEGSIQINQHA